MTVLVVLLYNAFRGSLPERWIPFALVLLSIAASFGLLLICSAIGKNAILPKMFICMTILCMLMVINLEANVAPVISQSPFPRIAFTTSEIKAAETISEKIYSKACPLYSDYYYSLVFRYEDPLDQLEYIDIMLTERKWPVDGMILVLREEVRDNPFYTGRKISNKLGNEQYQLFVEVRENPFYNDRVISNKLGNELYQSFVERENYSLFYSCGSVKAMKYWGSQEK